MKSHVGLARNQKARRATGHVKDAALANVMAGIVAALSVPRVTNASL
jgi:hypothetical protein